MLETVLNNVATIILALITTGTIALWIRSKFAIPTTKSQAKKTDAEAAVILLEGWEKITQTLKEQMRDMENRYETRVVSLERRIQTREEWYTQNLEARDRKIERLQQQIFELKNRLSIYESRQKTKKGHKPLSPPPEESLLEESSQ